MPTRQVTHFAKSAGTARFAWNWALGQWRGQVQGDGKLNEMALHKPLNAIKNLGAAFRNFFEGRG